MSVIHKDNFGNIIHRGDLVACSALRYRTAELRVGVVSEVLPGSIVVVRISKSWGGNFSHRKYKCGPGELIVLRWDMLKEESEYYEYLNELKMAVAKQ